MSMGIRSGHFFFIFNTWLRMCNSQSEEKYQRDLIRYPGGRRSLWHPWHPIQASTRMLPRAPVNCPRGFLFIPTLLNLNSNNSGFPHPSSHLASPMLFSASQDPWFWSLSSDKSIHTFRGRFFPFGLKPTLERIAKNRGEEWSPFFTFS